MKKKANIYDADDVERSKRLNFSPEERAARAEHKAEVLGTKLEKAKKKVPKKKKLRLQKELDPEKSRLKHTLRFEEVEKKRGQEALPKKAGRRMVQSASAAVHSKIHQVEEENVGTKAAHRTELASEGAAALTSHEIRKYRQNAPYKRVEKLEAQVNRANVSAAYRAAVRDNPELQENAVKRLIQKQRIKRQYARYSKWCYEDLPIIPEEWKYTVAPDKKDQYEVLVSLMNRPDVESLVCATDFADIQNKKECGGNRQWQNQYSRKWAADTKGREIT